MVNKTQKLALSLLEEIKIRNDKYYKINREIQELGGEFSGYIQCIDSKIEDNIVSLLDEILEPDVDCYAIASYYLYECDTMKNGGLTECCGKQFIIKTIDDVQEYVEHISDKTHHKQ